jgi:ubiquinone biosynthesis monooxygenase Coq7
MDRLILGLDRALRAISGLSASSRPNPSQGLPEAALDAAQRRHSAGLMRVNHVGEVCAQALYDAQGHFSPNSSLKQHFAEAGRQEQDHLAWTSARLAELGSRHSILNPVWYGGAYLLGAVAATLGDARNLGFVAETERQVEAHLTDHLERLPAEDLKSRAIVEKMRADEAEHGAAATAMGGEELPLPARKMMQAAAKVMTTTAYYL